MRIIPNEKNLKKVAVNVGRFIFLLIVIYTIYAFYHKYDLKTVIIISSQNTIKGLNILNGANLLTADSSRISNILKKQNQSLFSIGMVKKYPQTLIFEIENRYPIAYLIRSKNNLYIDKEGIIFTSNINYQNIPAIDVTQITISEGQRADWKIQKAISIIDEFRKQSIIIDQILIDDASNNFNIKLAGGLEILLSFNSDTATKASSLQAILKRFKIVGKNINRVDFRFDKPVVILSNGEKISSILY